MNWFSQALIIIFVFGIVMALLARSQKRSWPKCGCGHESSWHANDGGCQYKEYGSSKTDYKGDCPCPRTQTEAERKVG